MKVGFITGMLYFLQISDLEELFLPSILVALTIPLE